MIRGLGQVRVPLRPGYRPLLLFPGERSRELDKNLLRESPLPVQLLVPDGNWRQASKVVSRHEELRDVERVQISIANLSATHLRRESKSVGMATLEAIAMAMSILEGEEASAKLKDFYTAKLKATLRGRQSLVQDCKTMNFP